VREHKCSPYGNIVDLDDPLTYSHMSKDPKQLDKLIFTEIGMTLVYMDHFNKVHYQLDDKQRIRINMLIKNFADERRNNYGNVIWLQEQLFLIQDETENQC